MPFSIKLTLYGNVPPTISTLNAPRLSPKQISCVIIVAVALIDEGSQKAQAGDDAREAGWFDISDELVNKTEDKSLVKEEWLCRLSNADKNINICARVEVTYRKGILKNRTYKVVDGDGLAADHAAIILEGYHHVKEALNA